MGISLVREATSDRLNDEDRRGVVVSSMEWRRQARSGDVDGVARSLASGISVWLLSSHVTTPAGESLRRSHCTGTKFNF